HDWTGASPASRAGVAWRRPGDWLRRPPVTTSVAGLYLAGPFSPPGNTPSTPVLAAALAAYGVHAHLAPPRSAPDHGAARHGP
ncbi:MAG: hypothetical protein ACLGIF_08345, partial [Actinomycetes bacterium]